MNLFNLKNQKIWLFACGLIFLPWQAVCQEKTITSSVVGHNHTDRGIMFSLNGAGKYLSPHSGGGGFVCCVILPAPWRPGLTAKVKWSWSGSDEWFEKIVPIPEYDYRKTGQTSVHFLRNGEIKVFVPFGGLGHPDYPLKGPEAGLWPPGGEPPTTGPDATMRILRMSMPPDLRKVPEEFLRDFIVCHNRVGRSRGIIKNSLDETDYALLAIATTGSFLKHPLAQRDLSQPNFSSDYPFYQWAETVPEDMWDTGAPLWEVIAAHPNGVVLKEDCSVVGK